MKEGVETGIWGNGEMICDGTLGVGEMGDTEEEECSSEERGTGELDGLTKEEVAF